MKDLKRTKQGLTEEQFYFIMKDSLTSSNIEEMKSIKESCEVYSCFRVDGILFYGDLDMLCRLYIKLKPSDKFAIWLDKKGLRID